MILPLLALLLVRVEPARAESLGDLCRAALDHAAEVRAASARAEQADRRASQSLGGLLPRVDARAELTGYTQSQSLSGPFPFAVVPDNQEVLSLTVQQPVFAGGSLWNRYKSGASAAEAASHERRSARESVLLETAGLVYRLLEAGEAAGEAASSLERRSAHLEAAKRRLEAGLGTDADTSRARADMEQAAAARITADREAYEARERLKALTGVEISSGPSVPDRLPVPAPEAGETSSNPELLAAERRVKAAGEALSAARGDLVPSVFVGGEYQRMSQSPETLLFIRNETLGFVKLQWDVFSGGSKAAAAGAARAAYDESAAAYDRVKRDRAADAAVARESLGQALALVDAEKARVDAARSAYQSAEKRYDAGLDSYLARLDAETALTEAEASLRRARYAEQRSVLDLHAARGTLESALLR